MKPFRLRTDLERASLGSFAFALGLVPRDLPRPVEGYVLDYVTAEEDEPDTYHFHVTASHERVGPLLLDLFGLLGGEVHPILEIGSRDAYRAVDVWMSQDPVTRTAFLRTWTAYAPFLLEDGAVSAGANTEEPAVEVFLDHWKGISVHVPLMLRERVEMILDRHGMEELAEPWLDDPEGTETGMETRSVLDLSEPDLPDVEDLLLELRDHWRLELNVDPEANVDDAGRELGTTLWYAMILVESTVERDEGAYGTIWLTASSLAEAESLVIEAVEEHAEWRFDRFYSLDRVAFDERPDELADVPPRPTSAEVLHVSFEPWSGGEAGRPEEAGHGG